MAGLGLAADLTGGLAEVAGGAEGFKEALALVFAAPVAGPLAAGLLGALDAAEGLPEDFDATREGALAVERTADGAAACDLDLAAAVFVDLGADLGGEPAALTAGLATALAAALAAGLAVRLGPALTAGLVCGLPGAGRELERAGALDEGAALARDLAAEELTVKTPGNREIGPHCDPSGARGL